jgi:hypothetical protein
MTERYEDMEEYLTLYDAWTYFALYDHNANLLKRKFQALRNLILWLGVFATVLAISYQLWLKDFSTPIFSSPDFLNRVTWAVVASLVIVLLPITISALMTYSSRIGRGKRWILLRGAAEAIKQEVFHYRVRAGEYRPDSAKTETREQILASRLKNINERMMNTEINLTQLQNYQGKVPPLIEYAHRGDDGYFDLTAEKYVEFRLQTQITFYRSRASKFAGQMRRLTIWILIAGGAGTFLAAASQEIWVAFTTALVAAFTSYIEYNQLENTVTSYNQSASDLDSIRIWWRTLSAAQKAETSNLEKLVETTENVLKFETLGWIQNMQDTLGRLDISERTPTRTRKPTHPKTYPEEKEVITDGTYYGPTDIPDTGLSDGAYYGPSDVPDAAISDGAYYGPTDVPDAGSTALRPEDAIEHEPLDLSPADLQDLDALLENEELDPQSEADFLFGGYPPDDKDIDVDDFLPGKSRSNK